MPRTATTTTTKKTTAPKKTTTPKTTKTVKATPSKVTKAATVKVNEVKPSTQTQTTKANVSWEQRQEMIRVSAYLRAERRGFQNGNEMQDWIEAEQEINKLLA